MKTNQTKTAPKTEQSIESAVDSMEKLKQWATDFVADYESAMTDLENGVEGWNPQDSVADFIKSTQDSSDFAQKILNLANLL